jgi:hypothetical protein
MQLRKSRHGFVPPTRPDMSRGGPPAHPQPAPAIGRHHMFSHSLITSLPHLRRPINDQLFARHQPHRATPSSVNGRAGTLGRPQGRANRDRLDIVTPGPPRELAELSAHRASSPSDAARTPLIQSCLARALGSPQPKLITARRPRCLAKEATPSIAPGSLPEGSRAEPASVEKMSKQTPHTGLTRLEATEVLQPRGKKEVKTR